MTRLADSRVRIQVSCESVPCPASWFGERILIVTYLNKQGILSRRSERVRFVRPRFGRDEAIDFLAVLFG
jgi:hypothetical protein